MGANAVSSDKDLSGAGAMGDGLRLPDWGLTVPESGLAGKTAGLAPAMRLGILVLLLRLTSHLTGRGMSQFEESISVFGTRVAGDAPNRRAPLSGSLGTIRGDLSGSAANGRERVAPLGHCLSGVQSGESG